MCRESPSEKRGQHENKSQSPTSLHTAKPRKESDRTKITVDNAIIPSEKQLRLTQIRPNLQILCGSNKHQMDIKCRTSILGFGKGF